MVNEKAILRALEECNEKAGNVERHREEEHDAAEPFVEPRWEDSFGAVSTEQVSAR